MGKFRIPEEYPYALRSRIGWVRSQAKGRVLHIGTEDADSVFDDTAETNINLALYDTICSVGALAMSERLSGLVERLHSLLSADGKLLFLEPEAGGANPDIMITLWNNGFTLLQVERFSVPGTVPADSRWWRKGHRTIWHTCVSGVARHKSGGSQSENQ